MEHQFWHNKWEQKQIGFHLPHSHPLLEKYWLSQTAGHKPGHATVLVPLCGKSIDLLWLRQQKFNVQGVELSAIAASDFFSEQQLTPTITTKKDFSHYSVDQLEIMVGDFFKLSETNTYSLIYDRAALIALPQKMQKNYIDKLYQITAPGSNILLITLDYDTQNDTIIGPPFSTSPQQVEQLFANNWQVKQLERADVLQQEGKFRKKGAQWVYETAWLIQRK
ncbi:thiopurine S-methyltransferase [Pelagibaculum spongiae]|uniref:Thiopurine S-methyltransferase n=1 Tax=Pelagibaculum spongiae TaxID=2080658 RepID=A0A2V1GYE1_9GAMM|nr:thiopurine S-methyltransferase [Pelagibaculum spongiae]PVZ71796.1 thiopurine S-methyltransferase [Pelagibaculum spongiae]